MFVLSAGQIYDKLGKYMSGAVYFPRIKVSFCLVFRSVICNIEACASKLLPLENTQTSLVFRSLIRTFAPLIYNIMYA